MQQHYQLFSFHRQSNFVEETDKEHFCIFSFCGTDFIIKQTMHLRIEMINNHNTNDSVASDVSVNDPSDGIRN